MRKGNKMKKKILSILMLVVIILCLTACGDNQSDNKQSIFSKELKTSDLSIEDFNIETGKTKKYGIEYYVATFTNNSKYPVLSFQIDYEPKDDVTETQLSVYNDFMKEHYDWIESDDLTGVILRASGEKLVENGSSIGKTNITIGYDTYSWYDSPSKEQFDLMEPKELQIGIIGENDVLYIAYYDYNEKEWLIDEESKQLNEWPKVENAKKVIKPECKYTLLDSAIDDEEEIYFDCYGINKEKFKTYIKTLQDAGYEVKDIEESYSSYYDSVETSDGYELTLDCDYEKEKLSIELSKK